MEQFSIASSPYALAAAAILVLAAVNFCLIYLLWKQVSGRSRHLNEVLLKFMEEIEELRKDDAVSDKVDRIQDQLWGVLDKLKEFENARRGTDDLAMDFISSKSRDGMEKASVYLDGDESRREKPEEAVRELCRYLEEINRASAR